MATVCPPNRGERSTRMPATWTVRSKIQSIARQNRAGAKMQPCRTPEDVRKLSDIATVNIVNSNNGHLLILSINVNKST